MARLSGALQVLAAVLVVGLAAHSAAAIPIPSLLATSDGGAITFISLANTSVVTGVDLLSEDNAFTASLLGSWADSKYSFTAGTVDPGTGYRLFVADLTNTTAGGKPILLGSLPFPAGAYNPKTCPLPILGPLTGVKSSTGTYTLQLTTHCTVNAGAACAKKGEKVADVISVYTSVYTPATARFTLGTIKADMKAVMAVPACTRATLIGVQLNNNVLYVLARTATTTANLGKNVGDLAVYELRSNFKTVKGVVVKSLSLVKTYRAVANGLSIVSGVPASAYTIIAAATDAKGITKVYNWASGRKTAIGGAAGTETTRVYDDVTTMAGNVYSALEDFTTVPAGDPPTGRIQLTTAAQLAAGQAGTAIATDVVPYFEIVYIGKA